MHYTNKEMGTQMNLTILWISEMILAFSSTIALVVWQFVKQVGIFR